MEDADNVPLSVLVVLSLGHSDRHVGIVELYILELDLEQLADTHETSVTYENQDHQEAQIVNVRIGTAQSSNNFREHISRQGILRLDGFGQKTSSTSFHSRLDHRMVGG